MHPHGPRYALVYPIFMFSEILNVDYDTTYSYIVPVMVSYIVSLNISVFRIISNRRMKRLELIVIPLFYVTLTLMMNGRIVFALLGASLFIYNFISGTKGFRSLASLMASLFLCTVSSGTLSIVVIWLTIYMCIGNNKSHTSLYFRLIFLFSFFMFFGDFLIRITNKNLNYYGGGFEGAINMLTHGAGKLFFIGPYISALLILSAFAMLGIIVCIIVLLKEARISKRIATCYLFFFVGASGGLFGFSTMAVSIPILLALAAYHYSSATSSNFVITSSSR
ncbi:hypothetical protein TUMSATVNIG1_34190 [Vibrio nigripulchritudo]|nr:hypothetical protein VNTUMSATTG_33900 [Vibrio nigripulchritudo]BDU32810.1 hypothetical protein TUMSATVNIG1_34190 [Vibrio nigripulchritudo]